ncbi:MAG: hypothetical protein KKB25_03095 [Nanoarchaeota archaeon]|nr:hypothetical protein [Nanoarchaeota archaeon]
MLTKQIQYFGGDKTLADVIKKAEEMEKTKSVSIKFYSPSERGKIKGTGISEIVGMGEEYC